MVTALPGYLFQHPAKFHGAAASVLQLALAGKKQDAMKAIGADSQFGKLSSELTRALMEWAQAA
jgi:hypothetical protein